MVCARKGAKQHQQPQEPPLGPPPWGNTNRLGPPAGVGRPIFKQDYYDGHNTQQVLEQYAALNNQLGCSRALQAASTWFAQHAVPMEPDFGVGSPLVARMAVPLDPVTCREGLNTACTQPRCRTGPGAQRRQRRPPASPGGAAAAVAAPPAAAGQHVGPAALRLLLLEMSIVCI